MLKIRFSAVLVALTLAACSNEGGTGSSGVGVGQFKDSNTQGLDYVSGNLSGVTLADGSFEFVPGGTVTFSVGGVELGTTDGKSVVTPVDLVPGGSSSSPAVQNIVRFLMTLDSNGDPSDGITISPEVQAAAVDWQPVAFDGGSFQTALNTSLEAANAADPDNAANRIIRDAVAAQNPSLARLREEYEASEQTLRMEIAKQWSDFTFGPVIESDEGRRKVHAVKAR